MKTNLTTYLFLIGMSLISISALATDIGGNVTSDETLSLAGSPYIITSDYIVDPGVTVTIEPGVEIQMNAYQRDFVVFGSLVALGTSTEPILFTSTGSNGGGSLALEPGGDINLEYIEFESLGINGLSFYDCGIYLYEGSFTANHLSFSNCGRRGGTTSIIADADMLTGLGASNTIDDIELISNTLNSTATWPQADPAGTTYYFAGDQHVLSGTSLTVEPGVNLHLPGYARDLHVNDGGDLTMAGTAADHIRIHSDDANGGGSLALLGASTASLSYVDFENLGIISLSFYDSGLYLETMSMAADHLSFTNCGSGGLISIEADPDYIDGLGTNNSLDRILLRSKTTTRDAYWPLADPSGFDYLVEGDITVPSGLELEIAAGNEINIPGYARDLVIYGNLIAQGSSAEPIRIYSEDSNGGGSLAVHDGGSATLEYVEFQKLGIISLSFYDSGIYIYEEALVNADNLTFDSCGLGFTRSIDVAAKRVDDFGPNNQVDVVRLRNGSIDKNSTWPRLDQGEFNYAFQGDINVLSGNTLTIEPGCEIDLPGYARDLQVYGTLIANGTAEDSIVFYSSDQNGGGSVALLTGSTGSEISYNRIKDLGKISLSFYDACIYVDSAEVEITKNVITDSRNGIWVWEGQPTIMNNIIKDNSVLGLRNQSNNDVVNACQNYWGDLTGPFNATNNPTGLGNGVSDNVLATDCFLGPLEIVCPENASFDTGDDYSAELAGMVEVCINDCMQNEITFLDDKVDPQCTEDLLRTWTVTDTCGNQASCDQRLSFTDIVAPTIVCPLDLVLECNSVLPEPAFEDLLTFDNCGVDNVGLLLEEEALEDCSASYERTYIVTDAEGNSATCSQTISFPVDTDLPVLTTNPDMTLECGEVLPEASLTVEDNCSSVDWTFEDQELNVCGDLNSIIRTFTAVDACGNQSEAQQTFTYQDNTPPTITVGDDMTIECGELVPEAMATASDACGETTWEYTELFTASCGNAGAITRTFVAYDDCGNSTQAIQTITIADETAPSLSIPDDMTLECGELVPEATATASDACGEATWAVSDDFEASCGGAGVITRTYLATDACGNSSIAAQLITITDETGPVFTSTPAAFITAACDNVQEAEELEAIDECSLVTITVADESIPTDNCIGDIARTWTATDECGNSTTFTQLIQLIDEESPELQGLPSDITVTCGTEVPLANVMATDNCSEVTMAFTSDTLGICPATITHTWTATDECGNSTVGTQVITLESDTPLTLVGVPLDMTLDCADEEPVAPEVTAVGSCPGPIDVTMTSSVSLSDCGQIITRVWTATDQCEGMVTATQVITFEDNTPPVFLSYGADMTLECGEDIPDPVYNTEDNCGDVLVEVIDAFEAACAQTGVWTRTYTATDDCGNTAVETQLITIVDNTPPMIACPEDEVIDGDGFCQAVLPDYLALIEADDACGEVTLTQLPPAGTAITASQEVIISAIDDCDNLASCSFTVTVAPQAQLTYPQASYCSDEGTASPALLGETGGMYSASPAGLSIDALSGEIDLVGSTPGVYSVSYERTGACAFTVSTTVQVDARDEASIAYDMTEYCPDDADPTPLVQGTTGGVFSAAGTGLEIDPLSGAVDLSASTPGAYLIEYSTQGPCPVTVSTTITVQTALQCSGNPLLECEEAIEISTSIFGVPSWETYSLDGQPTIPGCAGDADDDRWFYFTADAANNLIIARDPSAVADIAIEVYELCGGELISCSNAYGAGAIERHIPTGLTPGLDYRFRVYDVATGGSGTAEVQVQVKTFEDGGLNSSYCDVMDYQLNESVYAERDDLGQLYANPGVPVSGYSFKFEEVDGNGVYYYMHPNGSPYMTLGNVGGLEYDQTYMVSVRHMVKVRANGVLMSHWSEFGTACMIGLQEDVPTTQLLPELCPALDMDLEDIVQAQPVADADLYRFTFTGAGETFVETVGSYGIFLYTVGDEESGLQYGQVYDVSVEVFVNGNWSESGPICQLGMAAQPEGVDILDDYCGLNYVWPDPNFILAEFAYGASEYQFRFTYLEEEGLPFSEYTNGLTMAFHLAENEFLPGAYMVEARAFAGGVWGDFGESCFITINAEGVEERSMEIAYKPASFQLYPNPSTGEQFTIRFDEVIEHEQQLEVRVMDLNGRLVSRFVETMSAGTTQIECQLQDQLESGVYLIETQYGSERYSQMLMVD